MKARSHSLDALRALAIIAMVLSSAIASSVLPAWMYHAQVGPRSGGAFDPTIYVTTWVVLVFPFFLFAMGAAFPFSIGSKIDRGESKLVIFRDILLRGIRLTFFAIFVQHIYPWSFASLDGPSAWLLTLCGFAVMMLMYLRLPAAASGDSRIRCVNKVMEISGYVLAVVMLVLLSKYSIRKFDPCYSNIILLVLANMAFWGSVIYMLTCRRPLARFLVLPFVMAIFLGSETEGSWNQAVMNFTPVPWAYNFLYLKYLFIVIPGTLAGDYMRRWMAEEKCFACGLPAWRVLLMSLAALAIVVVNLVCLYSRWLVANLFITALLLAVLMLLIGKDDSALQRYWRSLFNAGAVLLMLGLFFEAYQGGVRKDDSTYSYYFITSGLAFLTLLPLSVICDVRRKEWFSKPLELVGGNPMLAYVATSVLVMPVFNLLKITPLLDAMVVGPWTGALRGIIVTACSVSIAALFSRFKLYWKS